MTSVQRSTLLVAFAAIAGLAAGLGSKYLSGVREGHLLAGIEGNILAVAFLAIDVAILIVGALGVWRAKRRGQDPAGGVTLLAMGFAALAAGLLGWELGPTRPYV